MRDWGQVVSGLESCHGNMDALGESLKPLTDESIIVRFRTFQNDSFQTSTMSGSNGHSVLGRPLTHHALQINDPKSRASRGTVCIISDDSDFVETLKYARKERWRTVLVPWL